MGNNNGVFDWTPERIWTETYRSFTLITEYSGGKEQRNKVRPGHRIFNLEFRRDESIGEEIWDFYVDRDGAFASFDFEHPDADEEDDPIKVRFLDDDLDREYFAGTDCNTGHTITVRLKELLGEDD